MICVTDEMAFAPNVFGPAVYSHQDMMVESGKPVRSETQKFLVSVR